MALNNLITKFREAWRETWDANRKDVANKIYTGPIGFFLS